MEEKTQAQKEKSPKRKHVGLIVFACAVLLAIILAVCLTGTPRHAITLPTGSADVSAGKEQAGYQLKDTNITVDNVQQVIASMKRPSSYSASVTNTLYWSGSWQKINATTYVRDGISVTEYKTHREQRITILPFGTICIMRGETAVRRSTQRLQAQFPRTIPA